MVLIRIAAFPFTTCRRRPYHEDHIQQRHKVNGYCDVIESGRQCTCDEFRPFYEDRDYSYDYNLDSYNDDLGEFYDYNWLDKMKKNLVVLGENIKVVVTSDQKSDWIAASILSPEFFSATEDCVKKKKQEVLARYDN